MDELHGKYYQKGLEILAFPCNQFDQEPASSSEIKDFIKSKYDAKYRLFEKIDVNGENAHPIFSYLRRNSELWIESKRQALKIPWSWSP